MADSAKLSPQHRRCDDNADQISKLSDDILCHILSYLPTKDAIRTSILSNRWRMVWTLVPVFCFEDDEEAPNERFLQCVNSTLMLRDRQRIKKFRLKGYYEDYGLLEACTNVALDCKVEHLELIDDSLMRSLLPPSVITCRTILVLKLSMLTISWPEITASSVHFPVLKTLYLKNVRYGASDDIAKFLCGCPVLEELKLRDLILHPFKRTSTVHFPMLKTLYLRFVCFRASEDIVKLFCGCPVLEQLKLIDLFIPPLAITSPVHLPVLKTFHLTHVWFRDSDDIINLFHDCSLLEQLVMKHTGTDIISLPRYYHEQKINLPSLIEAEMSMKLCAGNHNLFKALYIVQQLSLFITDRKIADEMQFISNNFPTFHNLVHLKLTFHSYQWDMVVLMLRSSPMLESLVIEKSMSYPYLSLWGSKGNSFKPPEHVSGCISVHLKELCYRNYEGIESELDIARYILENAKSLENMTIYWDKYLDLLERYNVAAKISTFPRSSVKCKLIFI